MPDAGARAGVLGAVHWPQLVPGAGEHGPTRRAGPHRRRQSRADPCQQQAIRRHAASLRTPSRSWPWGCSAATACPRAATSPEDAASRRSPTRSSASEGRACCPEPAQRPLHFLVCIASAHANDKAPDMCCPSRHLGCATVRLRAVHSPAPGGMLVDLTIALSASAGVPRSSLGLSHLRARPYDGCVRHLTETL